MKDLKIRIELISESIFGSGKSFGNIIDTEILKDDLGFPYLNGKTFKGKLREEMKFICKNLERYNHLKLNDILDNLLGVTGNFNFETLKFSNCEVSNDLRVLIKEGLVKGTFDQNDILNSLTDIRTFTKIENGVSSEKSLRNARVIKKGLVLYSKLETIKELNDIELGLLCSSLRALKSIGMMESRGKGAVNCSLIENEVDVTDKYILAFRKEVS